MTDRPGPAELWILAEGDSARYLELLQQHGIVVPNEPCPACGVRRRHRHGPDGALIPTDVFGHDQRTAPEVYNDAEGHAASPEIDRG